MNGFILTPMLPTEWYYYLMGFMAGWGTGGIFSIWLIKYMQRNRTKIARCQVKKKYGEN